MILNSKDLAAGAIFAATGIFYGIVAYETLPIGRALEMGPGYFPIVLSMVLVVLGLAIALRGAGSAPVHGFGRVPWRAVLFISLATLLFAHFLELLGLPVTVFATVYLSTYASREFPQWQRLAVSAVLTVICTVLFHYVIRLPVPLLGEMLGG